jgi:hypothetical protein
MTKHTDTTSAPSRHAGSPLLLSGKYPQIEAACAAVTAAMALTVSAKSNAERIRAGWAEQSAADEANSAYGEELLPALFGGTWRLSTRHANFPDAIFNLGKWRYPNPCLHALFDHPLVFRSAGSRGPDCYKNTVIIGRPYPIVTDDGELTSPARENAAWLAARGWGCWWRKDLSAWYPGWTQLVVAKHGIQACGTPDGFLPIASATAGVAVWDEWRNLPASYLRQVLA